MKPQLIVIVTFLLLFGCKTQIVSDEYGNSRKTVRDQRVKISGIAVNGKDGALVLTENDNGYYLNKKVCWKKKDLNKKVVVKGRLYIVTYSHTDTAMHQEIGGGSQNILKRVIVKKPSN